MPFHSLETRWFVRGELDPEGAVVRAFRDIRPVPRPEDVPAPRWPTDWREDTYLVIPGNTELGIKWRGEGKPARFEVKGRLAETTAGGIPCERWVKWSDPGHDLPSILEGSRVHDPDAGQIRTRKQRLLRKIRLDGEAGAVEVGPEAFPDRGLMAELTRLQVGGEHHWTLGFEAFPAEVDPVAEFTPLVRAFLEGLPADAAPEPASMTGYPGWLQHFLPRR